MLDIASTYDAWREPIAVRAPKSSQAGTTSGGDRMPKATMIADAAQALATVRIAGKVLGRGAAMVGTRDGMKLAKAEPWLSARLASNTATGALRRITAALDSGRLPESAARSLEQLMPELRSLGTQVRAAADGPRPLEAVAAHARGMSSLADAIRAAAALR
jgi:hypothetical protein